MFNRKPDPRLVELDTEITRVLAVMSRCEPDSDEYKAARENWTAVCEERSKLLPSRFTKDQLLLVGGNIVVALAVIGHERAHVVATNVHKFLTKASR